MSTTGGDGRLDRTEQSVGMLRQMLDGSTYDEVASAFGVTRTAVERRIKALALRLVREVGVPELDEADITFGWRLRARREALLATLDRFERGPVRCAPVLSILSDDELARAAARVRARSRARWRDLALFYMLFATGARPLEIARLRVDDYLAADGRVRRVSELPAQASVGGRARPLYFSSRRLDEALGAYLGERVQSAQGVGDDAAYRGLDPKSRLFLSGSGEPFAITPHGDPGQRRLLCRPIQELYRKILRHSGLPGASPLTARRLLVDRMYARGADEEQVGQMLGICELRAVRESFPRRRPLLEQIVEDLV